jgi:galactitol-specific phosphotransferase system IIB component
MARMKTITVTSRLTKANLRDDLPFLQVVVLIDIVMSPKEIGKDINALNKPSRRR